MLISALDDKSDMFSENSECIRMVLSGIIRYQDRISSVIGFKGESCDYKIDIVYSAGFICFHGNFCSFVFGR